MKIKFKNIAKLKDNRTGLLTLPSVKEVTTNSHDKGHVKSITGGKLGIRNNNPAMLVAKISSNGSLHCLLHLDYTNVQIETLYYANT